MPSNSLVIEDWIGDFQICPSCGKRVQLTTKGDCSKCGKQIIPPPPKAIYGQLVGPSDDPCTIFQD